MRDPPALSSVVARWVQPFSCPYCSPPVFLFSVSPKVSHPFCEPPVIVFLLPAPSFLIPTVITSFLIPSAQAPPFSCPFSASPSIFLSQLRGPQCFHPYCGPQFSCPYCEPPVLSSLLLPPTFLVSTAALLISRHYCKPPVFFSLL